MLKINKKVEYALIALKFMLDKGANELTTAREISERHDTPFDTTAKVMQVMNNFGILASVKGVKGGYYLSGDLSGISYMELAELVEGKSLSMDCATLKCNLIGKCNITGPVSRLNGHLYAFLNALTVKELLLGANPLEALLPTTSKETAHEL